MHAFHNQEFPASMFPYKSHHLSRYIWGLGRSSAHAAWVKCLTQAAWAEAEFQFVSRYFAAILDFHSVWYREVLVHKT